MFDGERQNISNLVPRCSSSETSLSHIYFYYALFTVSHDMHDNEPTKR